MKYFKPICTAWAVIFAIISVHAAYNHNYEHAWRALAVSLLWLHAFTSIKEKD